MSFKFYLSKKKINHFLHRKAHTPNNFVSNLKQKIVLIKNGIMIIIIGRHWPNIILRDVPRSLKLFTRFNDIICQIAIVFFTIVRTI